MRADRSTAGTTRLRRPSNVSSARSRVEHAQAEIEQRRLARRHDDQPTAAPRDPHELRDRGRHVGNELERAHRHDGVERAVAVGKRAGRRGCEPGGASVPAELRRDRGSVVVHVGAEQVVGMARELGHEHAAAVADFEQALRVRRRGEHRRDTPHPEPLHPTQHRPVVPIGLIEIVGLHRARRAAADAGRVP